MAMQVGNLEIIKLLIEPGKANHTSENIDEVLLLPRVLEQNYDETKKLEILQYLLPLIYTGNGCYFSHHVLLLLICCYEDETPKLLVIEYLMEQFYSKYNSLLKSLKKHLTDLTSFVFFSMMRLETVENTWTFSIFTNTCPESLTFY